MAQMNLFLWVTKGRLQKKTSAKLWTLSKVFGTPHPPSKVWTSLISFINLKSNSSQNAPVSSLARNVE